MFFAILFYVATAVLVGGLASKIADFARTPAPLKIPTTPAPTTTGGVVLRMFREVALLREPVQGQPVDLDVRRRHSISAWLWCWCATCATSLQPVWFWVGCAQPFGMYAGFAMVAGLAGLWARRFLVDRVRYISTPSDHLMLALLLLIGSCGLSMTFVSIPTSSA